jgi:hypothetical protein
MAEPDLLGFVERAGLSAGDAAAVLGRNAAQLLGLDPDELRLKAREVLA